ncbi:hypothetical protein HRG_005352 [Hirsutella rhossiliensis]|uniref:Heterokaryon incompatibility domain-containing protein n=1 Tax=Hirsutella rhossiliensis TaxID=111463 RepID=A0A9P8MXK3_9HYPO|nr:uncharacterized protein HRG_05352 [Hirsutella rhossiliensis]KAH0962842.1 hypothetical protein HRG_05352 [Hirsutella rhossiliensis]
MSSCVAEGFLQSRTLPPFLTIPVELPNRKTGHVNIGHPCPWAHFGWHIDPLSKRGWTFQEFLLARRVLFYGPYELLFHCQELGFRALAQSYINYPSNEQPSSKVFFNSSDRHGSWCELLRQYTFRTLSVYDDRPQAIAGVVVALEEAWGDRCVFGAWVSYFLEHLTWFNVANFHLHPSLERSNRAPSWSWLSIDGHVAILCRSKLRADCTITTNLLDVAKGAKLTLACRLISQLEWPSLESSRFTIYWDLEQSGEAGVKPCFYLYLGSESYQTSEQWFHAFALITIEEQTDVLRRIGIIDIHTRDVATMRDVEKKLQTRRHVALV